ncbi:hypothetical protein V8E55_005845 [Tylopilus felleus]
MSTHCVQGRFDTVGGVGCYLATPTGEYSNEKAILFLPDVLGIELVNSRVVAVDLFEGDAAPMSAMDASTWNHLRAGTFDFGAWLPKHGTNVTRPRIDNVIAALKQQRIKEFAATGYCFGGSGAPARYVFDLAFDGIIKAAAVSHPSLLNIPDDLYKLKATKIPLLINSCEFDPVFPADAQAQADAVLGGGHINTDLYRREYFQGCTHGFAVRGDLSDPKVKAGKEGSFKATVEFFSVHF